MRYTLQILAVLLIAGCTPPNYSGLHVNREIGSLDLTAPGVTHSFQFKCPLAGPLFTLVVPDEQGQNRDYCSHPDWPLVLAWSIAEQETGVTVLSGQVASNMMVFANWNLPATCLVLETIKSRPELKPGSNYLFKVTVDQPMPNVSQATIHIVGAEREQPKPAL